MDKYGLDQFSNTSFALTKKEWSNMIDEDAFFLECARVFDQVESHLNHPAVHYRNTYYGLFKSGSNNASAIVELVTSPSSEGTLTKSMNVILSPEYWDKMDSDEAVANIYLEIITRCFERSVTVNNGYCVKLYGRSNSFLKTLKLVHDVLLEKQQYYIKKVEMAGRWLVIKHVNFLEEKS